MNKIPLSEAEKEAQKKYNKEFEGNIDGIIRHCFDFFFSVAEKLNEDEINKFQSGFNKKQLKRINRVTGDIE